MTRSVIATSSFRRAAGLAGAGLHALKKVRATDETVRRNASVHLAERLGRLRGLPQKKCMPAPKADICCNVTAVVKT